MNGSVMPVSGKQPDHAADDDHDLKAERRGEAGREQFAYRDPAARSPVAKIAPHEIEEDRQDDERTDHAELLGKGGIDVVGRTRPG